MSLEDVGTQATIEYPDGAQLHLGYRGDFMDSLHYCAGVLKPTDHLYEVLRDQAERGVKQIGAIEAYEFHPAQS